MTLSFSVLVFQPGNNEVSLASFPKTFVIVIKDKSNVQSLQ